MKNASLLHLEWILVSIFSINFFLDAKARKSGFWNISNFGLCRSSLAWNLNFKNKRNFWNPKIYRKFKFHRVWDNWEISFLGQSWTKYFRKIDKIKRKRGFFGMFCSRFFTVFWHDYRNVAFGLLSVDVSSVPIFSEIFLKLLLFPKILTNTFFTKLWGNLYIDLLVIIS